MPVRRFLVVVALCGATLLSGAAAGCGKETAKWLDPRDRAAATGEEGVAQGPAPERRNSLEMSAATVFFLEGVLPLKASDGTTSALNGRLLLRGQCHDGTLKVTVTTARDGARSASIQCDGRPHEQTLGVVKLGDPIGVTTTGKAGTDFAIDLQAK